MKKIISLLSVVAIVCTLFTSVAFADTDNKFYCEKSVTGTDVKVTFYVKTNKNLKQASGALDLSNAYGACDEITFVNSMSDGQFNVNSTQKVLSWTVSNINTFTGTTELGYINFINVKTDFTLSQKRAFTAKTADGVTQVDSFTNEQVGYVVEAPTPSTPTATAGNAYEERSTFYGDTVEIPTGATQIDATITKGETTKNDTVTIPSGVWGGKTKILPIVSYKVGENGVTAGDIFTLILKNGATELGKWTYTVPAE